MLSIIVTACCKSSEDINTIALQKKGICVFSGIFFEELFFYHLFTIFLLVVRL